MITYHTEEDDTEINAILDEGLRKLDKITSRKYNDSNTTIYKQHCLTEKNNQPIATTSSSILLLKANKQQLCKLTKPVKALQTRIINPIQSFTLSKDKNTNDNTSYSSSVNKTQCNNTSHLLRKTRDVLIYLSRNHTPSKSITIARNKSSNNSLSELKVLKEQTNERWKEKYNALQLEYNNVTEMLNREIIKNNNLSNTLKQLNEKDKDIPTLHQHQSKLQKVFNALITQCKDNQISNEENSKQIIKLQKTLQQIRYKFHNQQRQVTSNIIKPSSNTIKHSNKSKEKSNLQIINSIHRSFS